MKLGDAVDQPPDRMSAIRRLLETGKLILTDETTKNLADLAAVQHDPAPTTKLSDVVNLPPLTTDDLVRISEAFNAVPNGGYCRRCGRALKDPKWIVQGIGKTCIKKEAGNKQTRFLDARGGPVALGADLTIEGHVVASHQETLPDGREVQVIDDCDVTHATITSPE